MVEEREPQIVVSGLPMPAEDPLALIETPSLVISETTSCAPDKHSDGKESPTPTIDAILTELGGVNLQKRNSAGSAEEARGRKATLRSHNGVGVASRDASTSSGRTLTPLASGSLTEVPCFSVFGHDYSFPPKRTNSSSEAGSARTAAPAEKKTPAGDKAAGKLSAASGTAESATEHHETPVQVIGHHAEESRGEHTGAKAHQRRDPERVAYATTCSCHIHEEEIACVKKKEPMPPVAIPQLFLPRVLAQLRRCPSCDRLFSPIGTVHTEKERLLNLMEEHWPCIVHLTLTGRIEAAFADE
ncbi:hypothetical protein JCM10908_006163 [Rhodotorula pacifica]|uniref:uncharacterized protein n=1 Tax=Rhodotorula pacifica TaxID=1495444 RepID=UPI00317A7F6A